MTTMKGSFDDPQRSCDPQVGNWWFRGTERHVLIHLPWIQNVFSFDFRMCFSNFDQFSLCVCVWQGAGYVYYGVLVELRVYSLCIIWVSGIEFKLPGVGASTFTR